MATDWSNVTLEHVRRTCHLFDEGDAIPRRMARNTFLLFEGRRYPAKFIRGLAYRLATGIELDPSRDYSGGIETVRFFSELGLETEHDGLVDESASVQTVVPLATDQTQAFRCPQKQAILEALRRSFSVVATEARFDWLVVPQRDEMKGAVAAIFRALQVHRGFANFAVPESRLRVDFFVPRHKLIIEYDERQHFTVPRALALEQYPLDVEVGFSVEQWRNACREICATDPDPPFRDEQRAFYDSLRDLLAVKNGFQIVRLKYGEVDWTTQWH